MNYKQKDYWSGSLTSTPAGEPCMFDTMKGELYCLHTAKVVYKTVLDCCERGVGQTGLKRKHHEKLFHASGPLESVALDILGPAAKSINRE